MTKILVHATEYERERHRANMSHVRALNGNRPRNASMCHCGMHTTTGQQPECRGLIRYEVIHEEEEIL